MKSSDNIAMIIPLKTVRFTIPGRLPGYNDLNSRWQIQYGIKQTAMNTVIWLIRETQLKPIEGKVIVEIRCYEPNKRRDDDNVTSGASKIILDALKNSNTLKGDGQKYARCVKHPVEMDRQNPRIEVEITPLEG